MRVGVECIQQLESALLMKNIFIKLKPTVSLKQQSLRRILSKQDEEQEQSFPLLDSYFQSSTHSDLDSANLILSLLQSTPDHDIKQKLYPILVYYTSALDDASLLKTLTLFLQSQQSIFSRIKFLSLVYKSIINVSTKKWIILKSIALIEQEPKISIYSNFVENFDALISELTFSANEYAEINLKMINYLEKHLVYKKLWKHYIVNCLMKTQPENVNTPEVDALVVKLLKSGEVTQETVALASQPHLKGNKFYPFLQHLLLGDFQAYSAAGKESLAGAGVSAGDLQRNIKIQAIPRILNGIKVASYSQISQILKIGKGEVESYIIEAIQNGLLKAKIDEFQETILINELKFRALRAEDTASLQKNISTLAHKLQQIAAIQ